MTKVCCLPQRQDGHVIGFIDTKTVDGERVLDLTTARFVQCDLPDDADGSELASKTLETEANLRASYALSFFRYTNTDGAETVVYDMDIKYPISPKTKIPGTVVLWINPWHLVNGPDGELARAIFEFNSTKVHEPPVYPGRKNVTVVEADPNEETEDEI